MKSAVSGKNDGKGWILLARYKKIELGMSHSLSSAVMEKAVVSPVLK